MRSSISRTRCHAVFQRRSSSSATRRFSGSVASYCLCARRAAYRAPSNSRVHAFRTSSCWWTAAPLATTAGRRLHDTEDVLADRVVYHESSERDAARFTVITRASDADVAQDVVRVASVADDQFAPPPSAPQESR